MILSFFFKILFIYLTERAREHKQGERQREREQQAPRWAGSPRGAWSWVMTWAEGKRLTSWATQASPEWLYLTRKYILQGKISFIYRRYKVIVTEFS